MVKVDMDCVKHVGKKQQNNYSDNYEEPVGDEWQIDPANPDRVMPQLEQSED